MRTKHTPGPWKVFHAIAMEDDGTPMLYAVVGATDTRTAVECEANERLIAAAPELLKALEHLLRCTAIPDDWAEPARAAIAKARGEVA